MTSRRSASQSLSRCPFALKKFLATFSAAAAVLNVGKIFDNVQKKSISSFDKHSIVFEHRFVLAAKIVETRFVQSTNSVKIEAASQRRLFS